MLSKNLFLLLVNLIFLGYSKNPVSCLPRESHKLSNRDGVVYASGTNPDTLRIKSNYYFYNLDSDEICGVLDAVNEYNAFYFKIKDTLYVKFELNAIKVKNRAEAIARVNEDTVMVHNMTYHYGNTLTDSLFPIRPMQLPDGAQITDLGSADNHNVYLYGDSVRTLLQRQPSEDGTKRTTLYKAAAIHEIGHNLGGLHGDPGNIMSRDSSYETQKQNCTENCGTGKYRYFLSRVDKAGVRAIIRRMYIQHSSVNPVNGRITLVPKEKYR